MFGERNFHLTHSHIDSSLNKDDATGVGNILINNYNYTIITLQLAFPGRWSSCVHWFTCIIFIVFRPFRHLHVEGGGEDVQMCTYLRLI